MAKKAEKKEKAKEKAKEKRIDKDVPEMADTKDESKRLKRVIGQIDGIRNMLDNGRRLEDVLTQCKAVHSALKSVETRLLKCYLDAAIRDIAKSEKKKSKEQKIAELMDLYKPVD